MPIKEPPAYDWYENGTEGLYREGEDEIAKYGSWSYRYAKDKIKGRFKAGEQRIKENKWWWTFYKEFLESKGIII